MYICCSSAVHLLYIVTRSSIHFPSATRWWKPSFSLSFKMPLLKLMMLRQLMHSAAGISNADGFLHPWLWCGTSHVTASCDRDHRTMGQNQGILRHQKITFPRAREWAKWASKRTSERCGGRKQSEQSVASEGVSGESEWVSVASERANGRASGPVRLDSYLFQTTVHWRRAQALERGIGVRKEHWRRKWCWREERA